MQGLVDSCKELGHWEDKGLALMAWEIPPSPASLSVLPFGMRVVFTLSSVLESLPQHMCTAGIRLYGTETHFCGCTIKANVLDLDSTMTEQG